MSEAYSIRPVRPEDLEGIYAIRIMRGVFENTMGLPSNRLEQSKSFLEGLGDDVHQFVAVDARGQVLGVAGLHVSTKARNRHTGGIGLFVHREYQRQGIGTALLTTLLDLADNWLMLLRVELEVYADNGGAIRLYERMGFQQEGIRRKASIRNGAYVDDLMMARLRPIKEE